MAIRHLPRTASVEETTAAFLEHGCVIIDELVPAAKLDRLESELGPYIEATSPSSASARAEPAR